MIKILLKLAGYAESWRVLRILQEPGRKGKQEELCFASPIIKHESFDSRTLTYSLSRSFFLSFFQAKRAFLWSSGRNVMRLFAGSRLE